MLPKKLFVQWKLGAYLVQIGVDGGRALYLNGKYKGEANLLAMEQNFEVKTYTDSVMG
jgi:hypothetical protein